LNHSCATDWAAVAESALNEWNSQLGRAKFTASRDTTAAVATNNRINNVTFRSDIYGTSQFGANTLAVTPTRNTDSDRHLNSNKPGDSDPAPTPTARKPGRPGPDSRVRAGRGPA